MGRSYEDVVYDDLRDAVIAYLDWRWETETMDQRVVDAVENPFSVVVRWIDEEVEPMVSEWYGGLIHPGAR